MARRTVSKTDEVNDVAMQIAAAPPVAVAKPRSWMADGPTMALLQNVMKHYHNEMVEAQLTVDIQFWSDPEGAPSVKVGGYEEFGKVITFPWNHRAAGSPDARIIIDAQKWEYASAGEREAHLDNLLERLEVVKTEKGEILRDKANRPKLAKRKFDLRLQGFQRCLQDHSQISTEAKQWRELKGDFEQLPLFPENTAAVA